MMDSLPDGIDSGKLQLVEVLSDSPAQYPHRKDLMSFLDSLPWRDRTVAVWAGIQIEGVLSVFLVENETRSPKADRFVWVVVGDLPPAYLVTDEAPNPICALDSYIGCMDQWVEAVRAGQPVDKLIPVNVPPKKEYADMLASRLAFIDKEIIEPDKDQLI